MSATANGAGVALTLPPELIEAVAARVAEMLAERQRPAAHELMSVDEAAELLRCRRQRLYDLSSQGKLPCLRDGSRLLFRRSDLVSYLEGER
jgi:excisionase family DNA binding protein